MPRHTIESSFLSRRALLKSLGLTPLLLRSSPLHGYSLLFGAPSVHPHADPAFHFSDVRLKPRYPAKSPLEDILRLVAPGSDEYATEKYAFEIQSVLSQWSAAIRRSVRDLSALAQSLAASIEGCTLATTRENSVRGGFGIETATRTFDPGPVHGHEQFLQQISIWLAQLAGVDVAEFEITGIQEIASAPLTLRLDIRYDIVGDRTDRRREERVGTWRTEWSRMHQGSGRRRAGRLAKKR